MEFYIINSLYVYGIFWISNYSELTKFVRTLLKVDEGTYWYSRLYKCPFCFGFWLSFFYIFLRDGYALHECFFYPICIGVLVYFLYLIEKVLQKHIIF